MCCHRSVWASNACVPPPAYCVRFISLKTWKLTWVAAPSTVLMLPQLLSQTITAAKSCVYSVSSVVGPSPVVPFGRVPPWPIYNGFAFYESSRPDEARNRFSDDIGRLWTNKAGNGRNTEKHALRSRQLLKNVKRNDGRRWWRWLWSRKKMGQKVQDSFQIVANLPWMSKRVWM